MSEPLRAGVKTESASQQVYREIMRGLYEGRYVPGQRLVETDLVSEYGTSRFIIKDTMKRLLAEGVVVNTFYRGNQIPRLTREETAHIHDVMQTLFALAGRQAANGSWGEEEAHRLEDARAELQTHVDASRFFDASRACNRFFRQIVLMSGNTEIMRVARALRIHIIRVQFKPWPEAGEYNRRAEIDRIAAAILGRDADAAEACIRDYFQTLARIIAALPDRAFSS